MPEIPARPTSDVPDEPRLWVAVGPDLPDVAAAHAFLTTERAGAVTVFVGTTRRWTGGVETVRLSYEAYEPMAAEELRRIADEALRRWPAFRVCLLHRTGEVAAGEPSVIVGAASAHRDAAFACCRFLIDTLKAQAPIWKRERFADGRSAWVEGTLPEADAATPDP